MSVAELPPPDERGPRRLAGGRVPPHNLEAEESLLGAMLLSREAIAAASDVRLAAADFYRPAHGHIYDSVLALYGAGEPVDPVTVADELRSGLQPSTLNIVGARPAMGKCVTADTLLLDPRTGARVPLGELVQRGEHDIEVITLDDEHRLTMRRPSAIIDDGMKPVFRV